MNRERILRQRIQRLTWLVIVGLVLSGATAIPLVTEVDGLVRLTGAHPSSGGLEGMAAPFWATWLLKVQAALHAASDQNPILFYGTDWLAFGHFVIALAFWGALRDPVRNRWLFDFGLIACASVIPFAMVFGAVRGIPLGWRMIDCAFGVVGFIPLWYCKNWSAELERGRE